MLRRLIIIPSITKRFASTVAFAQPRFQQPIANLLRQPAQQQNIASKWLSLIQPVEQPTSSILNQLPKVDIQQESKELYFTSVLRKRRLKMKKHKLRKRRKAQRALKIKIGK
ncbi:unnamed protein product [Ambrosiozyma monospora]|uniref:Unnamed protein product n=1 Tax=Ambrosiozyma monospora TaxID=43982 RepID=A0ACB5T7H7_AMBMO|nr:unnamed protein product [Ambrosiozyma monospora]